jgi:uncharacterized membrane protein YhaH (DUF805 family)
MTCRPGSARETQVGFAEAVKTCFAKYVTFSGRAARPEYWYWVLFGVLVSIVLAIVDFAVIGAQVGILHDLFSLATILPSIAVATRRLHDIDRSGWWQLLFFVPLVGAIILIFWLCRRDTLGANSFG